MIDGYTSVQAIRRLDGKQNRVRPPQEDTASDGSGVPPPDTVPKAGTFGHTALPTRHELICYSCGYVFVLTGRLEKVLCPKCKTRLETGDKHIDGAWSGTLKTVGRVYINSGAVVTSSRIIATDIRVSGVCRNSRLEPTRHLELDTGAQVELDKLGGVRIVIIEDAKLMLDEPLRCRSLENYGELQADARPAELAVLHPASMFRGTLHSPRLVVHEGAGIKAFLHVSQREADAAPAPASTTEADATPVPASTTEGE
jgi:hypothetical protein